MAGRHYVFMRISIHIPKMTWQLALISSLEGTCMNFCIAWKKAPEKTDFREEKFSCPVITRAQVKTTNQQPLPFLDSRLCEGGTNGPWKPCCQQHFEKQLRQTEPYLKSVLSNGMWEVLHIFLCCRGKMKHWNNCLVRWGKEQMEVVCKGKGPLLIMMCCTRLMMNTYIL